MRSCAVAPASKERRLNVGEEADGLNAPLSEARLPGKGTKLVVLEPAIVKVAEPPGASVCGSGWDTIEGSSGMGVGLTVGVGV